MRSDLSINIHFNGKCFSFNQSGTLANDINFQVYLLDGLFRWNQDREAAAVGTETREHRPRTYSGPLKNLVNRLYLEILGEPFFEDFRPPGIYTGDFLTLINLALRRGEYTVLPLLFLSVCLSAIHFSATFSLRC